METNFIQVEGTVQFFFLGNPNNLLQVTDVIFGSSNVHYTPSNTVLQGRWSIVHRQGIPPYM